MSCHLVRPGPAPVVVCRPGPAQWVDMGDPAIRWCFVCRRRVEFRTYLFEELQPTYYDPAPARKCTSCKTSDADLFPGQYREWGDP